ncbi:MAG: hypothetical protein ACJ8IR_06405, partial [Alphaproteobacteria bacterium]
MTNREAEEEDARIEKIMDEAIQPYAMELGLLLYEWNTLHVTLTSLFVAVCQESGGAQEDILLAAWNAVPNDRLQRHMLRQAARVRFTRRHDRMKRVRITDDEIS